LVQKKLRRPFSVHVFLVGMHQQEPAYLLLQRRARPELGLPGFWQGVSGALEDGESFEQAAVREVLEETGIAIDAPVYAGIEHAIPIRPQWRGAYGVGPEVVAERVFYAQLADRASPRLSAEHLRFAWCSYAQALDLLDFGNGRASLQAVHDKVCSATMRG